ncbi:hypothetical protein B2K_06665 [Paenibacillus mucilaginosus K02]|uniref:Uncharacterized protein n=1 Tax=Paenibacillus mucilaginosus K02 TaxID=997761 RepID=I0BDF7_9BACL|nr:hypothetical protein B2K_06665 [Paenibacillus mucilaginosus K02]
MMFCIAYSLSKTEEQPGSQDRIDLDLGLECITDTSILLYKGACGSPPKTRNQPLNNQVQIPAGSSTAVCRREIRPAPQKKDRSLREATEKVRLKKAQPFKKIEEAVLFLTYN